MCTWWKVVCKIHLSIEWEYFQRHTHPDQIYTHSQTEILLKCEGGSDRKTDLDLWSVITTVLSNIIHLLCSYQDTWQLLLCNTIFFIYVYINKALLKMPFKILNNDSVISYVSHKSHRQHCFIVTLIFQNIIDLACVNWKTCCKLIML